LAAPAIHLARDGFLWSRLVADLTRESVELLTAENPEGTVFLPAGSPIEPGRVVRLPGLAAALEAFVARGRGMFEGPVGEAIVATVARRGGVMTEEDLRSASGEWIEASEVELDDLRIWATPEPTHGPSLLAAVADPRSRGGPGGLWDAVADAIRDRAATLGDVRGGGTSIVSAADREGNAVVVVHSNSYPRFGSGIVVPGYDLILNNRAGRGFTASPGHPNAPAPGRRPALTLHAWAVGRRDPDALALGGTPGGENQMPWNAQTLGEILAGSWEPGRLVTTPRWGFDADGGGALVETGSTEEGVGELRARTAVRRVPPWGLRSGQQVVVCPDQWSAIVAAADPRTGGAAVGV
jgi:gamma-glutamyltranspeptidase/glutathione hydrolase